MDLATRSLLDDCLLDAFTAVLARRSVTLGAKRIGGLYDPAVRATLAAIWELTFRRAGRLCVIAWAALVPGAAPDLLDLLPPLALERPGPAPRLVTEPSADWPDEGQRTLLLHWGRLVHRHDAALALLAALAPDEAEAECLRQELLDAQARCALAVPTRG
jgi:hypothetical protein